MFLDNWIKEIQAELSISFSQVKNVINLFTEGSTIPFISRYRKEVTGGLDEVALELILNKKTEIEEREKRRAFILETLETQKQLTKELKASIEKANSLTVLEDIYAPFKKKRKTKSDMAKEMGLEGLAFDLLEGSLNSEELKKKWSEKLITNASKEEYRDKLKSFADCLLYAKDIVIEEIAHHVELKEDLREFTWSEGRLSSMKRRKAEEIADHLKFKDYFEYEIRLKDLKSPSKIHQYLAMNRGKTLKVLKVEISYDEERALKVINSYYPSGKEVKLMEDCRIKALKNYLHISLDLEIKSELKKLADLAAIDVFSKNLKNLLLMPYLGQKAVMGIDPGVRTGCKIAVIDRNGNYLNDQVIYPFPPKEDRTGSYKIVKALIEKFNIRYIAIGSGTFGRETYDFLLSTIIPEYKDIKMMLVSEDGASVYSASEIAREEFPDKDVTVRGAVSIARRFQDPLSELVKVTPKSLGVGQYQHDVAESRLKKSLGHVVENCVNYVGVDLNTASAPLLSYVAGVGDSLAKNIIEFRKSAGGFKDRKELLKVKRLTPRVFEQAAGFLKILGGNNPLDKTSIHPERYQVILDWCQSRKIKVSDLLGSKEKIDEFTSDENLKQSLGVFTFNDITEALLSPGQDPREQFQGVEYRQDLRKMTDLKIGEWYPGVISNITKFGAFIDIGIKEKGLAHISQLADTFVSDPLKVVKVGQTVKARVMDIDFERKRISLSLVKNDNKHERVRKSNKNHRPEVKQKNNSPFSKLKNFKV